MDQLAMTWDRVSLAEAAARRDVGIQRAADHAEREAPGWGGEAMEFLTAYAAAADAPFLAEDVVAAATGIVPAPADGRAWGAVFKRAAGRGVVVRIGYAPARSSHLAPKCLWQGVRTQ
jgi:hypothetical protein